MYHLTRFSLRHPGLTAGIAGLISIIAVLGALRVEPNAGFRAYVGADHPAVRQLDAFIERFGDGLPAAAVWSCADSDVCENVFDGPSLMMAHQVTRALEGTPGLRSVQSPANASLMVPTPDGFDVRIFVENGQRVADADALSRRALIDPFWRRNLVSSDGRVGAVVLELASSESSLNIRVMEALLEALRPFEARGFEFNLVGDPVEFVVAGADLRADSARLIPVIVALIGAILVALFRSWRCALIALGSVGLAVVWAFGVMGWLGWPQTAVSQALAPFILTVGVCNAVHVLSRYAGRRAQGEPGSRSDREKALLGVVGDVGSACLLASITTAAGFASFATSGAVSFVHFGLVAATGVLSGLILSFSLLPILLVRLPRHDLRAPRLSMSWNASLRLVIGAAQRRCGLVLLGAAVAALVSAAGARLLEVDVSVSSLFGEETHIVRWIRFAGDHLRRPETLEVVVTIPAGEEIEDPEILERFAGLVEGVERASGFGGSASVLTLLGWTNRLVHDDDPSHQRHADSAAGNAELLLLLSSGDPETLEHWVSADRSQMRISLEPLEESSYRGDERRIVAVRRHLASALPVGWSAELTGPLQVRFHLVDEVQATQLRSFGTATAVVFVLVAVFLRSVSWGLAAMVPTLLPVLVTLGAMGAWGIYLDMGTAMIAAVVLGIAIDDTVHLLVQYRRRRLRGLDPTASMQEAGVHVGRAVVTTSVALSLGFFVLTLSSWASVASFGFLSGIAILGAMLADLIVLPALTAAIAGVQERSGLARRLWAT